jgi:hypothetical protein
VVKKLNVWVFAAAAAVATVLLALMYPRVTPDPDFAVRRDLPGVANFGRLTLQVWRGHAPDSQGIETLKEMGVRTIIDFRTHGEGEGLAQDPDVHYVRMPFSATDAPPQEIVDRFLVIVTDPDRLPVFFHCRYGKDRTGAMAALYRIRVQGWEPEKAVREMKYFGFRTFYRDLLHFVRSQQPPAPGRVPAPARRQ